MNKSDTIELVKNLRKNLNLSRDDLGLLMGVCSTTVYRWESGTASVSGWQLSMMKVFLKASEMVNENMNISETLKSRGIPFTIYFLLSLAGVGGMK